LKLKLDENLGRRGAELFRAAGHDVATVPEQNLAAADDTKVIAVCAREGRCLVTLDLDFANPRVFKPSDYAGIAVLRYPPRPGASELRTLMVTLRDALSRSDVAGKLWIVEPGRVREYEPPE
jgi:hypothetical protein